MSSRNVLVAGAGGMAGRSLIAELGRRYPALRVIGTYHTTSPDQLPPTAEYIPCDLTDLNACRKAVRGCDAAVLAAAVTGGAAAAVSAPEEQMTRNLVMDSYLLQACHEEGVRRVIFLSSATVYQEFDGFIREDQLDWNQDPPQAHLGVGTAKRAAEKLCHFWRTTYGLPVAVIRLANIYGPFARFSPERSNFIPAIIRKAVDLLEPFEVWGRPDVVRDVLFIDDFAEAVCRLLALDPFPAETFNLGSGRATRVDEVVREALDAAGHHPARIVYVPGKPGTVAFRGLDCGKLLNRLQWAPKVSTREGIRVTTDWWRASKGWWQR